MSFAFTFAGYALEARASGALHWPDKRCLVVSDLHLGKSERYARLNRGLLPPYENEDALKRLASELDAVQPKTVIFLGDTFDDDLARISLSGDHVEWLQTMLARRETIWITGNHDKQVEEEGFLGGRVVEELHLGLRFRHIRREGPDVSGHYHPVLRVAGRRWRCFAVTKKHLILPAFGQYTGGLDLSDPVYSPWLGTGYALVCGRTVFPAPLPVG